MIDAERRRQLCLVVLALSLVTPLLATVTLAATSPARAAAPTGTATPTPTPTPTPTGANAGANNTSTGSTVATSSQPAHLVIEQAPYIDEPVGKNVKAETAVYSARGNWLELRLANVNHSAVRRASVAGDTASITDKGTHWEFNAGHTDGSYRVVFQLKDGTRLRATIKVERTNLAHVPESKYNDVQQDAANWTNWEQLIIGLFGEQTSIESQTQAAAEFLRFKADPVGYVLQNPVSILVILFTTPSGIFIVGIAFAAGYGAFSGIARIANRWRRFSGDEASIEEKQDHIEMEQKASSLEGQDLNRVFGHYIAERWRSILGVNSVFGAFLVGVLPFMDRNMLRDRLAVMDYNGYRAAVSRAQADGGTTAASGGDGPAGAVEEVEIAPTEQLGDDAVRLTDLDEDAVAWIEQEGHPAVKRFNLPAAEDPRHADPESEAAVAVDLHYDLREVADELFDRQQNGLSTREQAEQLAELLAHLERQPITDSDGHVQSLRVVLNGLLRIFNVVGDKEGVPMVHFAREHVEWLLNRYREEREIDGALQDIQAGKLDLDDDFEFSGVSHDD